MLSAMNVVGHEHGLFVYVVCNE